MKYKLILSNTAVLLVAFISISCASLKSQLGLEYERAIEIEKIGTVEAYEEYFKEYPNGLYYDQMLERMNLIIIRIEYEMAFNIRSVGTIDACEEYFKKYPNGKYYNEMIEWKNVLIARSEFDKAEQQNTIVGYEIFLNKYSKYDAECTRSAENAITRINQQVETKEYTQTKNTNTIDGYEEFILKYPAGDHIEQAKRELEHLIAIGKQEEERIEKEIIENVYKIAFSKNSIEALEIFITECSDESYRGMATKRIATLKRIKQIEEQLKVILHVDWTNYNLSNPYGFNKNEAYAFFNVAIFQWLNSNEILVINYRMSNEVFHFNIGSIDNSKLGNEIYDAIAIYSGSYEYNTNTARKIVSSFKLIMTNSGVLLY